MAIWKFEQLSLGAGKGASKTLTLEDYAAPFGRPRKQAVAREVIKSRTQTVRYPGSDAVTRVIFGTHWEEMELSGRWMTRHLPGALSANDMADRWTEFIRDERPCRISWGSIVSYVGYVEELGLDRESEDEIAWRIKLSIDKREDFVTTPDVPPEPPSVIVRELTDFAIKTAKIPNVPDVKPDLFASLEALASQFNKVSAELNRLAGEIDSFEKAAFTTLQHFRGAITGCMTAIVKIRETIANVGIDSQNLSRAFDTDSRTAASIAGGLASTLVGGNSQSDIAWLTYRNGFDTESTRVLARLALLDTQAELSGGQEITRSTEAREGDTWESIALRAGGLALVAKIRELNGVRYGERPVPGELYLLP